MSQEARNAMAAGYCSRLKNFVTSLHANTAQLRNSMGQKPPAYADLSSFLLDFNDRVAEDSAEVELLGELTVENVSFEELLAHCMELYKQTEIGIAELETQLEQFGYSKVESAADGEEKQALEVSLAESLKQRMQATNTSPRSSVEGHESLGNQLVELQMHSTPCFAAAPAPNSNGIFDTIRSTAPRTRLSHTAEVYPSPVPYQVPPAKVERGKSSQFDDEFSLEIFGISASSLSRLSRPDQGMSDRVADRPANMKEDASEREAHSRKATNSIDDSCGPAPPLSPTRNWKEQFSGITPRSNPPVLSQFTSDEFDQVQPFLKKRVILEELNDVIGKLNDAFHGVAEAGANDDEKRLELEESLLLGYGNLSSPNYLAGIRIAKQTKNTLTLTSMMKAVPSFQGVRTSLPWLSPSHEDLKRNETQYLEHKQFKSCFFDELHSPVIRADNIYTL